MTDSNPDKPGLYRHYKGNVYRLMGTVRHSETLEYLALYARADSPDDLWVRPIAMFHETFIVDGKTVRRFTPLENT